jgi:hypothetical protein
LSTGLKANVDGSAAIQVGGVDAITLTSAGAASFVTSPTSLAGNLTFTGTGNRITGDFSNATVANRVSFQTSTVNGATSVYILPNGTSPTSQFVAVNNSDPTNASVLQLQVNATDYQIRGGITGTGTYLPMTFFTGGTETARFSATAKTLILSGGDTTANGTGITFPATQSASSNANTLDDYEETTFTPSFAYTTPGTSSFTYANRSGTCRKIGAFVFATGYISLSAFSKGTASGQLIITGFPFTASVNSVGSVNLYDYPLPAGSNSIGLLMELNQTYCFLFGNGSNTLHPTPDPDGNSQIWFAVCYATST